MNYSPRGSSVCGILPASLLESVAIPFTRGSSQPRYWTQISCITGRFFTSEPPRKPKNAQVMTNCVHGEPELRRNRGPAQDLMERKRRESSSQDFKFQLAFFFGCCLWCQTLGVTSSLLSKTPNVERQPVVFLPKGSMARTSVSPRSPRISPPPSAPRKTNAAGAVLSWMIKTVLWLKSKLSVWPIQGKLNTTPQWMQVNTGCGDTPQVHRSSLRN